MLTVFSTAWWQFQADNGVGDEVHDFVPGSNSEQSTYYHQHIMNNIGYCSEMHLLVRLEGFFRQTFQKFKELWMWKHHFLLEWITIALYTMYTIISYFT